jgi:hypothetical protein|tara:strand:+ start:392 stop:1081 length:690 start_codon:yes stop_codon:yes gene_type:complete
MAKKLLKKIAKAALAAGAAYGMSKAMAGKKDWRSNLKHTYGKRSIKQVGGDAKIAEAIHGAKHFRKPSMLGDVGGSMDHMSGRKKWWQVWKNKGGPINAYQGDLVKSETRGTGAAVKGTTHEIMPGMDAAKSGKMIHAKQGYYAREDESIGMRLGKGKATKKNKKKAKKERDESYGDWGKRGKDWKVKKARHGTMVRTRGSNPDNPYVMQGGSVDVHTKLNGTLKTRTW